MKPVKSSDEEKADPKKRPSLFIANEIGPINHIHSLWYFVDRILSIEHNFMPMLIVLLGFDQQLIVG